ncbi:hypothetical protein Tco_1191174 [Tanacetum coccineum]
MLKYSERYSRFAPEFQDKSLKTFHWNRIFFLSSEILGTLETSHISLMLVLTTYTNHEEHLLPSSTSAEVAKKLEWTRFVCPVLKSSGEDSISRHEDTQVYGTILPMELTNQAMLESKAYKTYYAFASGEKALKPKYVRKKADSDTSPKKKPVQSTKGTRLKTQAKVAKSDKKKKPAMMPKAKGLNVLSVVALTEAEQMKLATERSKKQFHSSHASGSVKKEDDEEKSDSERTESDREDIPNLNQSIAEQSEEEEYSDQRAYTPPDYLLTEEETNDEEEKMDEEEEDEVIKDLYKDVNVNLGIEDVEMTDVDQGGAEQQNVSQVLGFEQVVEDTHMIVTPVLDEQKTDDPVQSSSISSDFTSKLLNLDNTPPRFDETSSQTSFLFTVPVTAILEIISATTVPPPPPFFNPLQQEATPTSTPTTSEATTSTPTLPDFASVFKFNERVTNLEKDLSEMKQVDQHAKALASIPAIVEDQDEKNEYIGLVDTSMRTIIKEEVTTQLPQILPQAISNFATPAIERKIIIYRKLLSWQRGRDDRDKDQDPSAGSDRGSKRRKSSKDVKSSRDSRSKENKSLSSSKDAS